MRQRVVCGVQATSNGCLLFTPDVNRDFPTFARIGADCLFNSHRNINAFVEVVDDTLVVDGTYDNAHAHVVDGAGVGIDYEAGRNNI